MKIDLTKQKPDILFDLIKSDINLNFGSKKTSPVSYSAPQISIENKEEFHAFLTTVTLEEWLEAQRLCVDEDDNVNHPI